MAIRYIIQESNFKTLSATASSLTALQPVITGTNWEEKFRIEERMRTKRLQCCPFNITIQGDESFFQIRRESFGYAITISLAFEKNSLFIKRSELIYREYEQSNVQEEELFHLLYLFVHCKYRTLDKELSRTMKSAV